MPVTFGPYQCDPSNGWVRRGNTVLPLRPKAFAVLQYLLDHAGQLVTKDEMFEAVWPEVHVTEGVLKGCIREIRQTLGDNARTPKFVETVHRRGYRFLALVRPVAAPASSIRNPSPKAGRARAPQIDPPSSSSLQLHSHRLVGRDVELAALQDGLAKAHADTRQIIFVTGAAGIGKTALLHTFLDSIAPKNAAWIGMGQCIEHYGEGEAYLPVLEALGRLCQQDSSLIALFERNAPSWLLQMPALLDPAHQAVLQRRVRGISQGRMLLEFAEALEMFTAQQPVVLALEDLQWSDTSTLELISLLARRHESARLLILGTYRSDQALVHEHPLTPLALDLHLHHLCTDLPLALLTETAVQDYLTDRFPDTLLPSQLAPLLYHRTQGHPLFFVHTMDYAVERGLIVQEPAGWKLRHDAQAMLASVPDTLTRMITQQFEHLQPDEQVLLETASLTGATFSAAAVAAGLETDLIVAETLCDTLVHQAHFLQTTGVEEWPEGTISGQYQFRHALYQDVIADRVGAARHAHVHRLIAVCKEVGYGTQVRAIAEELAVHFEHGRLPWKAVEYQQMAVENGFARLAWPEVQEHLSHGLRLLNMLPDTPARLQYELPMLTALITQPLIAPLTSTDTHHALQRVRELALREDLGPALLPYVASYAEYTAVLGEYAEALRYGEHCLALARQTGDPSLLGVGGFALIFPLFYLGNLLRVQAIVTELEVIDAFSTENGQEEIFMRCLNMHPRIGCLSAGSWSLWALGYPDRARAQNQQLLAMHRDDDYLLNRLSSLSFAGSLSHLCRDTQTCLACVEDLAALNQDSEIGLWEAYVMSWAGWALVEQGHVEQGLPRIHEGFSLWKSRGMELAHTWFFILLADAYLKASNRTAGLQIITEAFERIEKIEERVWEAELWRLRGELLLMNDEQQAQKKKTVDYAAEAETCFAQALQIAHCQQAKSLELRAAMSLARLWQDREKITKARDLLTPIYNWFTEGFDTKDLQEAKTLLEELG